MGYSRNGGVYPRTHHHQLRAEETWPKQDGPRRGGLVWPRRSSRRTLQPRADLACSRWRRASPSSTDNAASGMPTTMRQCDNQTFSAREGRSECFRIVTRGEQSVRKEETVKKSGRHRAGPSWKGSPPRSRARLASRLQPVSAGCSRSDDIRARPVLSLGGLMLRRSYSCCCWTFEHGGQMF